MPDPATLAADALARWQEYERIPRTTEGWEAAAAQHARRLELRQALAADVPALVAALTEAAALLAEVAAHPPYAFSTVRDAYYCVWCDRDLDEDHAPGCLYARIAAHRAAPVGEG